MIGKLLSLIKRSVQFAGASDLNEEITGILGVSLENAKIRLHSALSRLKTALKEASIFYYTEENTLPAIASRS